MTEKQIENALKQYDVRLSTLERVVNNLNTMVINATNNFEKERKRLKTDISRVERKIK